MSASQETASAGVAQRGAGPMPGLSHRFLDELAELCLEWPGVEAPSPGLVVLNDALVDGLGLDAEELRSEAGVAILSGGGVPDGARPVALAYSGHQFGNYSPRLGDGRALLLGELDTAAGALVDVHLKGSGRTPFARGGDGRATIGPMLREYVVSEFMHAVGVPTTRSLAVASTGEQVRRERIEPGAVLTRTAASHIRVGTFEYALRLQADDSVGDDLVERLVEHSLQRHYPELSASQAPTTGFLEAVVERQAQLVAGWMLIGFIHGVMNTDNMTISGETIDYGPCAFMDHYDPATVFSSIDHAGRYAFGNQPAVASWNLARLAETLLDAIAAEHRVALDDVVEQVTEVVRSFGPRFQHHLSVGMAPKLGLLAVPEDDPTLFDDLLAVMHEDSLDWTTTFRSLAVALRSNRAGHFEPHGFGEAAAGARRHLAGNVVGPGTEAPSAAFTAWARRWSAALEAEARSADAVADAMDSVNPLYVPRNHIVEDVLEAANDGDTAPFGELVDVLADPFTERGGLQRYAAPAPPGFTEGYRTFCGT